MCVFVCVFTLLTPDNIRRLIFFAGGLVLGLTLSASARDLHEVLHEEMVECSFINNLHPWGA